MKEVLKEIYNNVKILGLPYKESKNTFTCHFLDGAFLEILGSEKGDYIVKFIDQDKASYQKMVTKEKEIV
jgi:hypothetical protein